MSRTLKDRPYSVIENDPDSEPIHVGSVGGERYEWHRKGWGNCNYQKFLTRQMHRRARRNWKYALRTGDWEYGGRRGETGATGRSAAKWDAA